MNNEIIEMEEIIPPPPPMNPQNEKLKNHWSDGSTSLLAKWERICAHRKKAHYSASNDYGWKNKFLSIPIIVISTILGSLSFIHPSFIDKAACSRRLSLRNLQPEWPTCVCNSYLNGAPTSGSDLCQNGGTTECYPMNPEDWSCLGGMFPCINLATEAPTFDDCPAGGFCIPCGTCHPGRCDDNSCPLFDDECTCTDGSCPSNVHSSICSPPPPIIYDEEVSGEANNSGNGGVETLPLVSGTNRIQGALKSPSVSDYYRVRAPDGGATITAMRLTMAGDGSNGVRSAYLRFFDATNPSQFVGQTGGGLIATVPADAVSMLEAPSSFSPSASGFAGWAHGQSDFLFMLSYGSSSGMMDNAYIIDIDCVISPTPSPTATKTPTNLPPTPSPTTNTPTNLPPTPSPTGLAYSSREAAQDACSSSGSSYSFSSSTSTINGVSTCMYNCNGVEGLCQTGSTPTPLPTQQPTPPFEGKSGKSGDSDGDGDGDGDGEECAPGCPDDWPGDGECDDSCFNSACNYDDGDCPTTSPTNLPTTSSPTRRPTRQPTTSSPTKQPTSPPVSYMQGGASARSTEEDDNNDVSYISYIIGAFNMFVAILSAVHTFLKFDTLADRHQQYSRHFGNLQVDIETLLCLPESQRGDAGGSIENFKTKYSVLMNNAPELSVKLEQYCIDGIPVATQVHNVEIELA